MIDNPPAYATICPVRQRRLRAVAEISTSPDIDAALIFCAWRKFMSGGDVHEFGQPPFTPSLPDASEPKKPKLCQL